jgi:hypothetical protein
MEVPLSSPAPREPGPANTAADKHVIGGAGPGRRFMILLPVFDLVLFAKEHWQIETRILPWLADKYIRATMTVVNAYFLRSQQPNNYFSFLFLVL